MRTTSAPPSRWWIPARLSLRLRRRITTPASAVRMRRTETSSRKKVLVLGSGPIRIGQGIEFDFCSVHSTWAFAKEGYETIIINNNPETVSTDFDIADKLYFEPLTPEDVESIVRYREARRSRGPVRRPDSHQADRSSDENGRADPGNRSRGRGCGRGPRAV